MQIPKVSIIVPCYNQAQYLDEALQSLYDQTYTDWECFVVNDGSPDHTEEIARKWEAKDPRFIYIYKENGGVSSARNLGIEKAKGEFILTLDADDQYEATFIEKALTVLLNNDKVGIVSSWGRYFTNDKQLQIYKSIGKSVADFLFYNAAIGTSLFRKECWQQVGGYDENPANGYEDWEFYLRVCALGWKVYIIEEVLFLYRQNIGSRSAGMNLKHNETQKYIYIKNKEIYCAHYEELIDQFLTASDLEKKEINKFKNTIDYKLGAALLKPLRSIKWFFLKLFK
ncbi:MULTISPECIES: glycosyltransferase family 2 protein [unclassified Flavobacterium]|jgi:glycosyltransferase involved in cell wall biosynthesis|uniref:glycosyltransferase family 2 protein n=1 Tax=unclassified Flavobacterium TaxID=196869 RepID=UPI0025BC2DCE|nr:MULTISPECIES: glycosyltransferase family A protein [unclassified Flavobacterium]